MTDDEKAVVDLEADSVFFGRADRGSAHLSVFAQGGHVLVCLEDNEGDVTKERWIDPDGARSLGMALVVAASAADVNRATKALPKESNGHVN